MASRLNPYIGFKDTARQAMEYYQQVFGGKLEINTFAQYGAGEGADADKVMHALLEADNGFTLMAADTPSHMEYQGGSSITISLSGDDGDELKGYWDKLSDGGTVAMPLEKQMWGDEFGMLTDKFGISWMVNIAQPQS
jgi:PhnB protein